MTNLEGRAAAILVITDKFLNDVDEFLVNEDGPSLELADLINDRDDLEKMIKLWGKDYRENQTRNRVEGVQGKGQ